MRDERMRFYRYRSRWHISKHSNPDEIEKTLQEGWEPFAVSEGRVYFKRIITERLSKEQTEAEIDAY